MSDLCFYFMLLFFQYSVRNLCKIKRNILFIRYNYFILYRQPRDNKMPVKVLFVLTSHSELGHTDNKTGWYLPEVAYTYWVLKRDGHTIEFVSPKGGKSPMVIYEI